MSAHPRPIRSGVYLVLDPAQDANLLLPRLEQALAGGLAAVQLWDHFPPGLDVIHLITQVCERSHAAEVPVFINNHWELLQDTALDGVHFDTVPQQWEKIRAAVSQPCQFGLTCNNDPQPLRWAQAQGLDYISFCSVFPSPTANSCDLVQFDTIRQAAEHFSGLVFLSGGIRPDTLARLRGLPYAGVAVVSGIMSAENPQQALQAYHQELNDYATRNH